MFFASLLACASLCGAQPPGLQQAVNAAVDSAAAKFKTAFSVGIVHDDWEVSTQAGVVNIDTGEVITKDTMIPGGSVTKSWTGVRTMQLVEAGKIDLDTPAYTYIDPWLKAQGKPTLEEMFTAPGSDITVVTVKELLGMESGLADYTSLQEWTIAHPTEDYLPLDFISNMRKSFLFTPGGGGAAYSSNGFVLLGMMLTAVTGKADWTGLDQLAAAGPQNQAKYNTTIFMHTGTCASHPNVPHQYYLKGPPPSSEDGSATGAKAVPPHPRRQIPSIAQLAAEAEEAMSMARTRAGHDVQAHAQERAAASGALRLRGGEEPKACSAQSGWQKDVEFEAATVIGYSKVSDASACCDKANSPPYLYYPTIGWSFHALLGDACVLYYNADMTRTKPSRGAETAIVVSPKPTRDWFGDFYNDSCLNGWTMGNIASSAIGVARFFHALGAGELVSKEHLAMMQPNHVFTTGFAKCSTPSQPSNCLQYGLGLLSFPGRYKVDGTCTVDGCSCGGGGGCEWLVHSIGHPGQDWGSGFTLAGYFPQLGNLSIALATPTAIGLNTNLTLGDNFGFNQVLPCQIMAAITAAIGAPYPTLVCG